MRYDEFHRPVSVDFTPCGRVCGWCDQPAERQLTAIGGPCHNQSGAFCRLCGAKFFAAIINSTQTAVTLQMRPEEMITIGL